ncbi:MAG: nucleoside triphosphate pyrophosphatase [Bdellovibrionales bacterium]
MHVVLASASAYRQSLLKQIHLPFEVQVAQVDEAPLKKLGFPPQIVAEKLAALKGETVQKLRPEALIIASDQVAHLNGQILSKPGTSTRAVEILMQMQGQTHELITALWMYHPKLGVKTATVIARLKFRQLSQKEIETYVDLDQPLDCAGAYKWEKAGVSLIEKMDCSDTSSIVGLPLIALTQILREWQLPLPFAWKGREP